MKQILAPLMGLSLLIALTIYRAVVHYNFLSVSVQEAAQHLFDRASDGIILLDAMNNENDAEQTVEQGLKTVGLDPSKVKTIIRP